MKTILKNIPATLSVATLIVWAIAFYYMAGKTFPERTISNWSAFLSFAFYVSLWYLGYTVGRNRK